MRTNETPTYDTAVNETGCCYRFNPEGWDRRRLHFEKKPFVRAKTRSALHVPLNVGRVFARVMARIEAAHANDLAHTLVLSRDPSAWEGEHLFAVTKAVPGEEMATLSGDFVTRVFEGPYRKARDWHAEMQDTVEAEGKTPGRIWFFYTTCPKCAEAYGKNYVIGVAETVARRTPARSATI